MHDTIAVRGERVEQLVALVNDLASMGWSHGDLGDRARGDFHTPTGCDLGDLLDYIRTRRGTLRLYPPNRTMNGTQAVPWGCPGMTVEEVRESLHPNDGGPLCPT